MSGIWPYDYGDYYLFVGVISQDNDVDPSDNDDYDPAFIAVGYYAETPELPVPFTDYNDDWTNLVNVDKLGVTLKPGTSLYISGNMSTSDYDDIFEFPLDPLITTVTVTASWQNVLPPSRQVTLWYFIGPGGNDDGFGGRYVTGGDQITVVWEPLTLPGAPYPMVWIDLENSDLELMHNILFARFFENLVLYRLYGDFHPVCFSIKPEEMGKSSFFGTPLKVCLSDQVYILQIENLDNLCLLVSQ